MDNKNKITCSNKNVTVDRRPVVHQGGRRVVAPSGAAAGSVQFRDGRGGGGGGRGFHAGQSQGKIAEQAIPIPPLPRSAMVMGGQRQAVHQGGRGVVALSRAATGSKLGGRCGGGGRGDQSERGKVARNPASSSLQQHPRTSSAAVQQKNKQQSAQPLAPPAGNHNDSEATVHPMTSDDHDEWINFHARGLCFVGYGKTRQNVRERTNDERFSSNFGVGAKTLHSVYVRFKETNPNVSEKDFFMTINQLKLYLSEHVQAGRWGIDENTFRHKWKKIVGEIAVLAVEKIKFDPDDFPEGQIFLMSVDGVNITIREPRASDPGSHWYDHKSNSAGISYEVAVDIRRSRILWISGPRPGKNTCFFVLYIYF